MHTRNKGFTLLELLIGITASLVIMAIGLGVARSVSKSSDAMAAQTTLMQLTASIKAVFPKADYTGLSSALMLQSGTVPTKMIGAGGSAIISPWGSPITLGAAPGNTGMFQIAMPKISSATCSALVASIQDSFAMIRTDVGFGDIERTPEQGKGQVAPAAAVTFIKDETSQPPKPYTTAGMVAACAQNNATLILAGS